MSRSQKKPLYTIEIRSPKWFKRFEEANKIKKVITFKTWFRNLTIHPVMIGHNLLIHNGKSFSNRMVTADMVGYKIGQFAPTRKKGVHGKAGRH